ncbi:MAG: hypothetical protein JXB14_04200, partial [Candidatus Altiarchaeota archaeon]|nr:hypothetical protein [Candidatus Altiarchaeota archaeon]
EYEFDVEVTDITNYADPSYGDDCSDQIAGGKNKIDYDIWIKDIMNDPDLVELTLKDGRTLTDTHGPHKLKISVPVFAKDLQIGSLHVKLEDDATVMSRVILTADKREGSDKNNEISTPGVYLLNPPRALVLCPVCNVEDVPYLLYYAGHRMTSTKPKEQAEKTCGEAHSLIERLEGPQFIGGCGTACPQEAVLYLGVANKYYTVGKDVLDVSGGSLELAEQADRYCLEAKTFASDAITSFCVRLGNPPGCT